MTNYLAFTPDPFSIELTYADLVKAAKGAGAESMRINLRFTMNDTFEFRGPIRLDDFLVSLAIAAAKEADRHMDKVLAQVIEELTEAIRLSVQYVGTDTLQAQPGWTWFDALMKYAPHKTKFFVPDEDGGEETKAWQDLEDDAYNRNVPGYVPKTDGYKGNLVDDGYVNVPTWQEVPDGVTYHPEGRGVVYVNRDGQPYYAGMSMPLSATFEQLEDFMRPQGPFYFIPVPEEHATAPADLGTMKPNAMAVYASDTDERVVIYRQVTEPDEKYAGTPFKYVRGAFNENGDFVSLDRIREVPDGYRLVNWGRDKETNA